MDFFIDFAGALFLVAAFLPETFFAVGFLAATFLTSVFLAVGFLLAAFLAAAFVAIGFLLETFTPETLTPETFLLEAFWPMAFFGAASTTAIISSGDFCSAVLALKTVSCVVFAGALRLHSTRGASAHIPSRSYQAR